MCGRTSGASGRRSWRQFYARCRNDFPTSALVPRRIRVVRIVHFALGPAKRNRHAQEACKPVPPAEPPAQSAAKSVAKSTASGPRKGPRAAREDAAVREDGAGTQALAAAFPFNANKPDEYGEAARSPARRARPSRPTARSPAARSPKASLAEGRHGRPVPASIPATPPLDRVRVDSGGQVLTTNLGVPVADNQNSLKAGLRGPDAARGLHPPREDHPLRPRAHPRAHRARARLGARTASSSATSSLGEVHARLVPRRGRASAPRSSCASRPWPASAARPTPRATSAASRSSSTPTRATSTSSATTSRCSSSRTR